SLPGHLVLPAPTAKLLVGGVGRDAVDPAPEGRLALEHGDLPDDAQQTVLGHLLGVLRIPGDAESEAIDLGAVAADQGLGCSVGPGQEVRVQRRVGRLVHDGAQALAHRSPPLRSGAPRLNTPRRPTLVTTLVATELAAPVATPLTTAAAGAGPSARSPA